MYAFGNQWAVKDLPAILLIISVPILLVTPDLFPLLGNLDSRRITTVTTSLFLTTLSLIFLNRIPLEVPRQTVVLISLLFVSMLLSTALSAYPWQGVLRLSELYMLIVFSGIFAFYISQVSQKTRELLFISLLSAAAVTLLGFSIQWLASDSPETYPWVNHAPFFTNIRHAGAVINMLLPAGLYLFYRKKTLNIAGFTSVSLLWALLFWMGGRAPVLSSTLVTLTAIILFPHDRLKLITAVVTGLLLAQYFMTDSPSMQLFRLFHVDPEKDLDQISSGRITIYIESLKYWFESSVLLGAGADAYRYITPPILSPGIHHPHNSVIEFLLSFGLIGTVLAAVLVIKFISMAKPLIIKAIKKKEPSILLMSALSLCSGLIHSLLSGVLYIPYSIFLFSSVTGILLGSIMTVKSQPVRSCFPVKDKITLIVLILYIPITLAITELYGSRNRTPSSEWLRFNAEYPIYLDIDLWINHTSPATQKTLLKIGAQYSDHQEYYQELLDHAQE